MENKQLERLSKKIFKIRVALGYATDYQIEKGWKYEMESVKMFIKDANKYGFCSCGGFNYSKLKSGNIRITLDTSFLYRIKK
jgi:hypothetical protein